MEKQINVTDLIILKKKENGKVFIDYYPIENPHRTDLDKLYTLCKDAGTTLHILEAFLVSNQILFEMLKYSDYCRVLSAPYQSGIMSRKALTFEDLFEKKESLELSKEEEKEVCNRKKRIIKDEFEFYDLPYAIESAYEKCKTDENILVFSQRKVGWSYPAFKLTDDFSIQFATNFGYGSASYFYTQLTFKNIDIFPFSDWIIYQYSDFYEIIRYSKKHGVRNDSWYEALKYGEDAINLYRDDENKFIEHYILNECSQMVDGLKVILKNNKFYFKQYGDGLREYTYDKKRLLLKFRGEKISGALTFISSINNYNKIIGVYNFIETIENLNKSIYPILSEELNEIKVELENNKRERAAFEPDYIILKNKFDFYYKLNQRFKKIVEKKERELEAENKTNIELHFNLKYPFFIELTEEFRKNSNEYHRINSLISELVLIETDFEKYLKNIKSYFDTIPIKSI